MSKKYKPFQNKKEISRFSSYYADSLESDNKKARTITYKDTVPYLTIPGTSKFISLNGVSLLNSSTTALNLTFWMRPTGTQEWIFRFSLSSNTAFYSIRLSGTILQVLSLSYVSSSVPVVLNQWNFIRLRLDVNTLLQYLYIDETLGINGIAGRGTSLPSVLIFGGVAGTACDIRDVRGFSEDLSAAEWTNVSNGQLTGKEKFWYPFDERSGLTTTDKLTSLTGIIDSGVTWGEFAPSPPIYANTKLPVYPNQKGREAQPGACYSPDGVDDFVTSPAIYASTHPTVQNNWGFCMWAKFDNSVAIEQCYFKKGTGVASNTGQFCQTTNGGSGPNFRFWVTSNYLTYAEHGIGWNEWLHLAYIMQDDNGTLKTQIYINGVFAKEENIHEGFLVFNAMLGGYTGRVPSGLFYDWRMFEGELTQSDIQKAMKGLITNKEVVWWGCNERDGTKAIDLSGNNYHGTITNATISTFHAIDDGVKYNLANLYGYFGDEATINECIETALSNGDSDTITNWWSYGIAPGTNYIKSFDFDTKVARLETTSIADNVTGTIGFGAFAKPLSYWQGTSVTYIWSFEYRGNVDFRRGGSGVEYGILTATESWQKHTMENIVTTFNASHVQLNFYMYEGGTYLNQPDGSWLEIRNLEYKAKTYIHPILPKSGSPIRLHSYTPAQAYSDKNEFSWRDIWFKGAAPFNPKLVESHCLTLNGTDQYLTASTSTPAVGSETKIEVLINIKITATDWQLIKFGSGVSNAALALNYSGTTQYFYAGSTTAQVITSSLLNDSLSHEVKIEIVANTGVINGSNTDITTKFYIDNILLLTLDNGDTNYVPTSMTLFKHLKDFGNSGKFAAELSRVKISRGDKDDFENCEVLQLFSFGEGAGNFCYNTGTIGGYLTITNFTEACWANTQDKFHYNALEGFSYLDEEIELISELDNRTLTFNPNNSDFITTQEFNFGHTAMIMGIVTTNTEFVQYSLNGKPPTNTLPLLVGAGDSLSFIMKVTDIEQDVTLTINT